MDFPQAIKVCFSKYVDFSGRASRPEFWWFALFIFLGSLVLSLVSNTLSGIFGLATLLPSLAAGARRLHDTDRTAWWLLLSLVPLVGTIVLIVFLVQKSSQPELLSPGALG